MLSLKDTLAQLPTANIEVMATEASQRPALETINLALELASVTPVTHNSEGMWYSCDGCSGPCEACCTDTCTPR
jgi:hypothetical protein